METGISAAALYAGVFGLIGVWLGAIVSRWRRQTKIYIGDGGNTDLIRAMRGQANFVESVPIALILFFALALNGAPAIAIHGLGGALVIARIAHGVHFSKPGQPRWQRYVGAGLSGLVLSLASLGAIYYAIRPML